MVHYTYCMCGYYFVLLFKYYYFLLFSWECFTDSLLSTFTILDLLHARHRFSLFERSNVLNEEKYERTEIDKNYSSHSSIIKLIIHSIVLVP
jgi:hypothetical protein